MSYKQYVPDNEWTWVPYLGLYSGAILNYKSAPTSTVKGPLGGYILTVAHMIPRNRRNLAHKPEFRV